jgi:peptidoglycan/LPS O-acetylase OafA/YrhL
MQTKRDHGLRHFTELDGLRGFAAFYVFVTHFAQFGRELPPNASFLARTLEAIAGRGSLAVDVFFVLSGFLITSLLLLDRENPNYFHNFYWKRVLRIQPAFMIFLLGFWFVVPHGPPILPYILLCIFSLANFRGRFHIQYESVAWSLAIEEQFYLLWPQAVRRLSTRALAHLAIAMLLFSTLFRFVMIYLRHGYVDFADTLFRIDGLSFGALCACGYIAPQELSPAVRDLLKILRNRGLLAVAAVALLLCFALPSSSGYVQSAQISLTNYLTFMLISAIAAGKRIPLLRSRFLLFMGSISYGFYLYHGLVVEYFNLHYGIADWIRPGMFVARFFLEFGIAIAISFASLHLIEKQVQKLRRFVLR